MSRKKRPEPPILSWLEDELRALVETGKKVEAVKRVAELTSAGLRLSKDYVDGLVKPR